MAALWRLLGFNDTLPPQAAGPKQRANTAGLTVKQLIYCGIVEGVGALIIAGGANFGIAYGMYVSMWDCMRLVGFLLV